ncbi:MAG: GDSL-type esterase/lipase family protein [Candidatus Omnitrophota bacterium]
MIKSLANIFLAFFSLFLTLVLVELGLRSFAPQIVICHINCEWRADDPVFAYVPKPNYHGKMVVKNQFYADLTTNAQGFRGEKDVSVERTPGVRRLLFLGDSFVFGWGVNDSETFSSVVERELNAAATDSPTEVINAAVYGFDIVEYSEMFNRVIKYSPDVLFLGFTLENDFNINPLNNEIGTQAIRVEKEGGLKYKVRNFLNSLHLVALLRDRLYINFPRIRNFMLFLGINNKRDIFLEEYPEPLMENVQKTEKILRQMKSICDQKGIRFVVLINPLREQIYCADEINRFPGYDIEKPNKTLKAVLDRNKIEYVDLLPPLLLESKTTKNRLYFDIDPHWTRYGHEVVAQQIVALLSKPEQHKVL